MAKPDYELFDHTTRVVMEPGRSFHGDGCSGSLISRVLLMMRQISHLSRETVGSTSLPTIGRIHREGRETSGWNSWILGRSS